MDQWGMKVDNGDSNLQQTKPKVPSQNNLKSQDSPIFFLQEHPPVNPSLPIFVLSHPHQLTNSTLETASVHKPLERSMDLLERNKTTANEAIKLEDAENHPLRKDKQHSERYFKLLEARRQLPVSSKRQEFLDVYHSAKFVFWDEYASKKGIICTLPKRLAASSAAQRVADEMDVKLGEEVGYSVRLDNRTSKQTRLAYATDGILLHEAKSDPMVSNYACVILDEAHERTLNTDILLALLKKALLVRDDLKVIIMLPLSRLTIEIGYLENASKDYLSIALHTAKWIHESEKEGDILVFLSTAYDCEEGCAKLRKATSDLDASILIEGVVYVFDTGLAIQPGFNPRVGCDTLRNRTISKASAQQRAGRAGRSSPGTCYRMYTKKDFDEIFLPSTSPAILQSDLSEMVLLLKALGFHDVANFDFVVPPHPEPAFRAFEDLFWMGYLAEGGSITIKGKMAAKLTIHPAWYNAFAESVSLGCSDEMITIAALENTQQSMFLRPQPFRYTADLAHQRFSCPVSDQMSLMNAFHSYVRTKNQFQALMSKAAADKAVNEWCAHAFLNRSVLEEAVRLRKQLKQSFTSLFDQEPTVSDFTSPDYDVNIRKALARAFFYRSAIRDPGGTDWTVHGNWPAGLHPDSSLVGINHEWVVYGGLSYSAYQYLSSVTAVDPEWLIDLDFFQDANMAKKGDGRLKKPQVFYSLASAREAREAREAQKDNTPA
ncbi:ATP-binding protein PRP16 [Fusarium tjaetaba]|uniref:RNA helicase n=1 Tax=Fusarium tjaetaba TaxID=1567544 RepID=A0A8H5S9Z6_9HYPO|nr:ATP-binding protein PRP16 [Fusarium tjaetaba]KAF5646686.1 ATP-binding protein PRP16 [Fusarium tjaetaba]